VTTVGQANKHRAPDLGGWYHGASNAIACDDGCGEIASGLADGTARRQARKHASERHHFVTIERTLFQQVYPPSEGDR